MYQMREPGIDAKRRPLCGGRATTGPATMRLPRGLTSVSRIGAIVWFFVVCLSLTSSMLRAETPWSKKGSSTVVRSTLRAVPATVPDPFLNRASIRAGLASTLTHLEQHRESPPGTRERKLSVEVVDDRVYPTGHTSVAFHNSPQQHERDTAEIKEHKIYVEVIEDQVYPAGHVANALGNRQVSHDEKPGGRPFEIFARELANPEEGLARFENAPRLLEDPSPSRDPRAADPRHATRHTLSESDVRAVRTSLASTLATLKELKPDVAGRDAETIPERVALARQKGYERKVESIRGNLASTLTVLQDLKADGTIASQPVPEAVEPLEEIEPPMPLAALDRLPIGSVSADISCSSGDMPTDHAQRKFFQHSEVAAYAPAARGWGGCMYHWAAPGHYHEPLYFEEANLERFGYSRFRGSPLQPVVSGARFFATVPVLPYLMSVRPPRECIYTLGEYRPGSCVPFQRRLVDLQVKAAGVQAAAVTGLLYAIP